MRLNLVEIHKSLSKAYLKQDLNSEQIDNFKANLKILFTKSDIAESKKEHEEHFKNIVSDFLKDTYYKNDYEINISKRKDLVIHIDKASSDAIGVIIEAKKPSNEVEMISSKFPNAKALHELLHYYMQERFINDNKELKHLIATNTYDWYIFDAADFERFFYDNKKLRKSYEDWNNGVLVGSNTDWFYNEVAKPFIEKELTELDVVYFNLRTYKEIIENSNPEKDLELVNLYKILSPEHLLKKSFANDSNTLNKEFYNELLHIIGLEEKAVGGKKIIDRKDKNREDGSLLENTINALKIRNKLRSIDNPKQFGNTGEEQLYNLGLELSITWLNRVLFLKLLEGQLIKYHKGNLAYTFINSQRVNSFADLDELFFEVLAIKTKERSLSVTDKYKYIPYLNSSLFEISELENKTIQISELKVRDLSLFPHSVLKNKAENWKIEKKNTLHYLLEFLSAYNFSSDSSAKIQTEKKTIINSSVLGLIFEKINGYRDGSIFTPGFITMDMSRKTIRLAVIQKFNEYFKANGIREVNTFEELYNSMDKVDIKTANKIINSLKICDPAVGSGHFLVSVLNELIVIKYELGILVDKDGKRLRDYELVVENDELIVTYEKGIFEYNYLNKESQRVQETLFHEKQTIIENCLFGVDINPNSVKICRLRLWIELLKNTYYKAPDYTELETLPNIDINIKCGNSLISRFALDADISIAFKKNKNWNIESYRNAVKSYRNAQSKEEKWAMEALILEIKTDLESEIAANDKRLLRLLKAKGDLTALTTQVSLFERTKTEQAAYDKEVKFLTNIITQLENELEEIRSNRIYENAFEWRFEFPDVLNDEGDFIGFDVVIGNPPYGVKFNDTEKKLYKEVYANIHIRTPESYNYFLGLSSMISKQDGFCNFIIPSSLLSQIEFEKTRKLILENNSLYLILNLGDEVFDDVAAPTCIIGFSKVKNNNLSIYNDLSGVSRNTLSSELDTSQVYIDTTSFLTNDSFSFIYKPYKSILEKCYKHPVLKNVTEEVATGVSSGLDKAYVYKEEEIIEYSLEQTLFKKLIIGGEINRYVLNPISNKKLLYITNEHNISNYPILEKQLNIYKEPLSKRREAASGQIFWYSLNWPRRQKLFENPKILIRQTANKIIAAYDQEKWYCLKSGLIIQLPENSDLHYYYLLALLNSTLFNFLYHDLVNEDNRIFPEVKPIQLFKLPICIADKEEQVQIITLVQNIIDSKLKEIDTTELEREIDQMVYQLYGLNEEEIEIVEKG